MGRGKSRKTLDLIAAAWEILAEIQPASVRAVLLPTLHARHHHLDVEERDEQGERAAHLGAGARHHPVVVDRRRDPGAGARVGVLEPGRVRRGREAILPRPLDRPAAPDRALVRKGHDPRHVGPGATGLRGHLPRDARLRISDGHQADRDRELAVRQAAYRVLRRGSEPSGLHMSEVDLPRRLDEYGGDVELVRLALTASDCGADLPSFATDSKKRDPRYRWYVDRYGSRCWELDALSPAVLRDRVADAIDRVLDHGAWDRAEVVERAERESLTTILAAWPGISGPASKYDGRQA